MSDSPTDTVFRFYVVGYLDVQGQTSAIERLDRLLCSRASEEELEAASERTVGVIKGLRRDSQDLMQHFEGGEVNNRAYKALPPETKRKFRELKYGGDVSFQYFSDTILICAPLAVRPDELRVQDVHRVLLAAASLMLMSPTYGVVLRGGLELGWATPLTDGKLQDGGTDIYGPAVMKAYRLESRTADYPRVVIGDGLRRFLLSIHSKADNRTVEARLAKVSSQSCMNLIAEDPADGRHILDYLGQGMQGVSHDRGVQAIVKVGHEFIKNEHQRLSAVDDKLAAKYSRLLEYYSSHLHSWELTNDMRD